MNPSLLAELAIDVTALPLSAIADYTAVQYFLTCPQSIPKTAPPLEQVRPYLECFHHLTQAQDWKRAAIILTTVPNEDLNEELHYQLGLWGYWQEQKQFYDHLLNRVNAYCDMVCWNGLGNYYDYQGEYDRALDAHQTHLDLAQSLNDKDGEWMALTGLGNVHNELGNRTKAEEAYQGALDILNSCDTKVPLAKGDLGGSVDKAKAMVLGNLANIAYRQQQYDRAQHYAQRCLEIGEHLAQPMIRMRALHILGDVYTEQGNPTAALSLHEESLALGEKYGDREQICYSQRSLGTDYQTLGEFDTALLWQHKSLELAQELGEPKLIAQAFRALGITYTQCEEYEQAKVQFTEYLLIVSRLKDKRGMLAAMQGLSYAENALENWEMAFFWEERCLTLAEILEDRGSEAKSHAYLGYGYLNSEEYLLALEHLEAALEWQLHHASASTLAVTYLNLATTCLELGRVEEMRVYFQQGWELASSSVPDLLDAYQELKLVVP